MHCFDTIYPFIQRVKFPFCSMISLQLITVIIRRVSEFIALHVVCVTIRLLSLLFFPLFSFPILSVVPVLADSLLCLHSPSAARTSVHAPDERRQWEGSVPSRSKARNNPLKRSCRRRRRRNKTKNEIICISIRFLRTYFFVSFRLLNLSRARLAAAQLIKAIEAPPVIVNYL